ncbi:MAG: flavin reductase family protein [Desulfobacteraceae bacterium]|nr:flavin reductase family protein [Desulfobacteraceae bacterium]
MKQQWQSAFGQMTYGIYVLTTKMDDAVNGMIASWVTQVSYDPPLIMAAVHPNRYSHDMIVNTRAFGLHIIDQSQKDLLKRFKGPDPKEKFTGLDWTAGNTGAPILKDCLAWFEIEVIEQHQPGTGGGRPVISVKDVGKQMTGIFRPHQPGVLINHHLIF